MGNGSLSDISHRYPYVTSSVYLYLNFRMTTQRIFETLNLKISFVVISYFIWLCMLMFSVFFWYILWTKDKLLRNMWFYLSRRFSGLYSILIIVHGSSIKLHYDNVFRCNTFQEIVIYKDAQMDLIYWRLQIGNQALVTMRNLWKS